MKKAKAVVFLLISMISSIFLFQTGVYALSKSDVVVNLQIDNAIMEVNGESCEIDEGRGTKPLVINGRTLVPIRAIIESFGGFVDWEESTKSVILTMSDDVIKLNINNNIAYLNDKVEQLDVAPTVINGRTMLPIRFVAEGFNLAVAWNQQTQTVSIIKNAFDEEEYEELIQILPEYSGSPYVQINNNIPLFKDYEIINASFEYYSNLDELGRCDVCMASIASDIMPTEKRESIGSVTPTGWVNASYEEVDGGYLYNRCHLIGYQLTGENANERNLITGTRYLNIEGMLPFENDINQYIEETKNRVMYRVTPVFIDSNLVADGVLLEGYSVEDNGEGISFCVYCYNVQPNIEINYLTGESRSNTTEVEQPSIEEEIKIYRTPTGKRYHIDRECGGKNSYEITLEDAQAAGLTPCQKCVE